MIEWRLILEILTGVILFLYGIEHFSEEIQRNARERFKKLLSKASSTPTKGAFLGAFVTSIIQSSTATSIITIGLVNAGALTFHESIGIIIGSNLGTTITSQLVAFKLTAIAPIFIILGFLISMFGRSYSFLGRPIFYFGIVFFSLELINRTIEPFNNNPRLIHMLSSTNSLIYAILIGFIITLIVQSSSVTTGLVIVLASQGLLTLDQSIPILFGANIGTTGTTLLASINLDKNSKKTALAHFMFNLIGVILFLPFISLFKKLVMLTSNSTPIQIANAHLIFNLTCAIIFIIFIKQFEKMITTIIPDKNNKKKRDD